MNDHMMSPLHVTQSPTAYCDDYLYYMNDYMHDYMNPCTAYCDDYLYYMTTCSGDHL